jgi:hypothetical protein
VVILAAARLESATGVGMTRGHAWFSGTRTKDALVDNLEIHRSESLVRFVAAASGAGIDLGIKNKSGILQRELRDRG